jgi:hypothetical protein
MNTDMLKQRRADRRWRRRATLREWGRWWWTRRVVGLPALGLLSIAIGVGMWSVPLGVVTFGIACWIFEWRVTS